MKKNIFDTSLSTTIELLLRRSIQGFVHLSAIASQFTLSLSKGRTLVRFVRYSTFFSRKDAKFLYHKTQSNYSNFLCAFAKPLCLCVKPFFLFCVSVSLWQTSFSQTWIW